MPSIWEEPFGRIVVEAFAAGVPVLGSASGGIGEMVIDANTGYRFAPRDAAALARLIEQVHKMTPFAYRQLSANAIAAAQAYTGKPVAEQYSAVLAAVAASRRSPQLHAPAK